MSSSQTQQGRSCPISTELVDGNAGRITAFLSLGLLLAAAWGGWGLAILCLSADFGLRALGQSRFSPLARAAGFLRRLTGLPERPVNAGPKRLAASVGCLFSLGAALALLGGLRSLGLGLAGILGLCAGLEAFLGFCLACQIYPWLPGTRLPAAH